MLVLVTLVATILFIPAAFSVVKKPAASLPLYLTILVAVPYWVSAPTGPRFVPIILAVGAVLLLLVRAGDSSRWSLPDYLVGLMILLVIALGLTGRSIPNHATFAVMVVAVPYLLGRRLGQPALERKFTTTVALFGVVIAILGLFEFFLDIHPFVGVMPAENSGPIWSPIQYRAGWPRSELAFGHSIVYGNVIAMAVPFVVFSRWAPGIKLACLGVMFAGITVSFSRNALMAGGVALLIALLFQRRESGVPFARLLSVGFVGLAAAVLVPTYLDKIGARGELADSTAYRSGYLTVLKDVQVLGIAREIFTQDPYGRMAWLASGYPGGKIVTLDSTPILWALQFGWVVALILTTLLAWSVLAVAKGVASPALIAVAAQAVTMATVAPITQYPYLYWLMFGMAVGLRAKRQSEEGSTAPSPMVGPRGRIGSSWAKKVR